MPPSKFNQGRRDEYLDLLRTGECLKMEAARRVGVSYRTVKRYRAANPAFKEEEDWALAEAMECIQKVGFQLAAGGDLGWAKLLLPAYARQFRPATQKIELDVSQDFKELTQDNQRLKLLELQATLADRRAALEAAGDVIDLPSEEV